jgi:hypothetical protein
MLYHHDTSEFVLGGICADPVTCSSWTSRHGKKVSTMMGVSRSEFREFIGAKYKGCSVWEPKTAGASII